MTASRTRTLPLRLPPLPGEGIDSWLEASAERLKVSTSMLLTSLDLRGPSHLLPDHVICLQPDEAERYSAATGIEEARLHAMTMRRFDGGAVVLRATDARVMGRQRWSRTSGSRYCPQCLTERQGRWFLHWRLSWSFACTRHRTLLRDVCPHCGQVPRGYLSSAAGIRPLATCVKCSTDLRQAPTDDRVTAPALLAAQERINDILGLDRDYGTAPPDPDSTGTAVKDLHILGSWLLDRSQPSDLTRFGLTGLDAWQYQHDRPVVGMISPPADAELMGATVAWALDLLTADPDESIEQLRELMARNGTAAPVSTYGVVPPGMNERWRDLSTPVAGLFIRAMAPRLKTLERLRYRAVVPTARRPEPGEALRRRSKIPQLLWPDWSIRLYPIDMAADMTTSSFRAAMSVYLLLPGSDDRNTRPAVDLIDLELPSGAATAQLNTYLRRGHAALLPALCRLADFLDEHGSPIDYQRRREVFTGPSLDRAQWRALCLRAHAQPGREQRLLNAQRFVFQLLTGSWLRDQASPLFGRSNYDRSKYTSFVDSLTSPLRWELEEHARTQLALQGIDEPLQWSPPADCLAGTPFPGRDPKDIALDALHELLVVQQVSVGEAAKQLDRHIDHVRFALAQLQREAPAWGPNSAVTRHQQMQQARELFTRDFLEREYVTAGKTLKQLEEVSGFSRRFITNVMHELAIPVRQAHVRPLEIDKAWLREQYVKRARSMPDIAAELDVHANTVTREAVRHGIPLRPGGVDSHPDRLQQLSAKIPEDIRKAATDGIGGWQRLLRFRIAMTYPCLRLGAEAMATTIPSLVRQFCRLEATIGAPLYQRGHRGRELRPTERGVALIRGLDKPHVRAAIPIKAQALLSIETTRPAKEKPVR